MEMRARPQLGAAKTLFKGAVLPGRAKKNRAASWVEAGIVEWRITPGDASMTRRLISSGSPFERDIGYSRAVVDGDWVFVSGTTGFDYAAMTISGNLSDQTEQCLKNIQSALRQAGADVPRVVRVTYVLPAAAPFPP